MLRGFSLLLLTFSFFSVVCATQAQTKPLTNSDIVQMTKAGFDEQTIIKTIHANEPAFDVSLAALLTLKESGVTKPVMDAMLEKQAKRAELSSNSASVPSEHLVAPTNESASNASRDQKLVNPTVYVEEISSQGGVVASSDTALEVIKTLQEKHIRVVTIRDKADFVLQVTRQLGKKSWGKDTKVVLSNRDGEVVLAKSTRSVGGAIGDVADYIRDHSQ